jgi:hypothetical protein
MNQGLGVSFPSPRTFRRTAIENAIAPGNSAGEGMGLAEAGGKALGLLTALLALTIAVKSASNSAMIAPMLLLQDPDKEPKYDRNNSQGTELDPVHVFFPENKYYSIGEDHQEDHRNKHRQAG